MSSKTTISARLAGTNSFRLASLYFHTIRYLRPRQIWWRLWYRLYRPRIQSQPAPPVRDARGPWAHPLPREQSLLDPQTACFLNQRGRIDDPAIWNDAGYDRLWLYNLHYFDDLNARGADERNAWHSELIERWIAENSPDYGNGWEPYPTSLRIVNWVKWLQAGNPPTENMVDSLATQARWLRRRLEYHILGNHLLANAKALCFAGLFFSGRETDRWHRKGLAILHREIPEQILPDGGHFERSPMYHLLVLEDLLDLINLHRRYQAEIPQQWHDTVTVMLQWSGVMRHPDGEIPFFNDAAFGIAPEPEAIDDYAQALDFVLPRSVQAPLTHLPQTGYARIERGSAVMFTDMAPVGPNYLPGHAHADTLSFELSVRGHRIFVNGGTSLYGLTNERERQRATENHNTVLIDETNSSEVWSGFRVARRAEIIETYSQNLPDRVRIGGIHDGYKRLPGSPMHRRDWVLKDRELQIADKIEGKRNHKIDLFFIVHPQFDVACEGNNKFVLIQKKEPHLLIFFEIDDSLASSVEPYTWNPAFGYSVECYRIAGRYTGSFPALLTSRATW